MDINIFIRDSALTVQINMKKKTHSGTDITFILTIQHTSSEITVNGSNNNISNKDNLLTN